MRYSTKQVKDSGIFTIFVGGGWGGGGGRHNFCDIWRGVRANLPLLRGGYCVIFLLARLIFRPPLLIIIAQSLKCFFCFACLLFVVVVAFLLCIYLKCSVK